MESVANEFILILLCDILYFNPAGTAIFFYKARSLKELNFTVLRSLFYSIIELILITKLFAMEITPFIRNLL